VHTRPSDVGPAGGGGKAPKSGRGAARHDPYGRPAGGGRRRGSRGGAAGGYAGGYGGAEYMGYMAAMQMFGGAGMPGTRLARKEDIPAGFPRVPGATLVSTRNPSLKAESRNYRQ
jgi:hypothetical protein